jgi:hypothetical protein
MVLIPTSLGWGLTLDWLGRWLEITISELVSFRATASIFTEGSGARDVAQLYSSSRAVAPEVVVRMLQEEPVLEAADDIFVDDAGDGGAHLEETLGIGP